MHTFQPAGELPTRLYNKVSESLKDIAHSNFKGENQDRHRVALCRARRIRFSIVYIYYLLSLPRLALLDIHPVFPPA